MGRQVGMSIRNIIGRSEEITRLDRCMEAISAQLIIIYGRRRVGKTYLINEYFNNEFAFKLTGAYKKTKAFQLESFADELKQKSWKTQSVPSDWRDAFRQLREYLETLPEKEKQVVFCMVPKRLGPQVEEIVKVEDSGAFMVVTSANEIYGEGYKDFFGEVI